MATGEKGLAGEVSGSAVAQRAAVGCTGRPARRCGDGRLSTRVRASSVLRRTRCVGMGGAGEWCELGAPDDRGRWVRVRRAEGRNRAWRLRHADRLRRRVTVRCSIGCEAAALRAVSPMSDRFLRRSMFALGDRGRASKRVRSAVVGVLATALLALAERQSTYVSGHYFQLSKRGEGSAEALPSRMVTESRCAGSRAVGVVLVEVEVVEARVAAVRGEVDGAARGPSSMHERVAVQLGEPRREHRAQERPRPRRAAGRSPPGSASRSLRPCARCRAPWCG